MIDTTFETIFEHRGYKGFADFSVEDDVYYGKLMGIADLVTYEAETLVRVEAEFRDAVDDYIITRAKIDRIA